MSVVQTLEDEITRLATLKMAAKIHSFAVCRHDDDDNVVKVTRGCRPTIAINVPELHFTCLKSKVDNTVVLCE